ncbi:KpsF/GutQ family sugar-phosphate isomerase [Helicobacter cappadocius]|uniref:KpsF/GutQ family sugar-phosphate isomerase n=1 Tax=Helicobacter cappadocius TaxID=3063998 RepID=A0AA90PID4_9HELI|nr:MULTISPECIES: KpsF/GutQ family sugar-phosphate isomerase [unclassified Helicobacter]MDO7252514.1 KpsF/GutQ family sugar-phosphate isomerase [Helicobacter sp. faydin-H75]MDP2538381.1 KpsF/GutQ family sugar-phosphate isomerase [Helicobacter sp. faydin-H76]
MDFSNIAKKVLEDEAKELNHLASKCKDIQWDKIVDMIVAARGKLIVCGVGKSGLIGQKISATLSSTGTPSFFLHPTEAMHGDLGAVSKEDIVLAISYSGESEELVAIMPHLKRLSGGLITMSKSINSSISRLGDYFIPLEISQEACPLGIAPTSSTTLTLALGDALSVCLMEKRGFKKSDFASYHPGGSLGKKLFVKLNDLMQTQNLPIINAEITLKEAVIKMTESRLGNAIIAQDGKLLAVLSDGDLRRAMMREDFNFNHPVISYACKNPKYCDNPNLLAVQALKYIEDNKIQFLVVTDEDKTIRGAIHLHTLISAGIE